MTTASTGKRTVMATKQTTEAVEATPAEFDTAEFNRMIARAKAEMNVFVVDARKKRPLFSKTQEQAVAKRDAILKSFDSFFEMIEGIKKEG